jgi:hypothetical protein
MQEFPVAVSAILQQLDHQPIGVQEYVAESQAPESNDEFHRRRCDPLPRGRRPDRWKSESFLVSQRVDRGVNGVPSIVALSFARSLAMLPKLGDQAPMLVALSLGRARPEEPQF